MISNLNFLPYLPCRTCSLLEVAKFGFSGAYSQVLVKPYFSQSAPPLFHVFSFIVLLDLVAIFRKGLILEDRHLLLWSKIYE